MHGSPGSNDGVIDSSTDGQVLARAWQQWCRGPWWLHVVAVASLAALAALRSWPVVANLSEPLGDEVCYLRAFESVLAGESPFEQPCYVYPSVVALTGGLGFELLGRDATVALMRALNHVGLGFAAWMAVGWLPASWIRRAAGAAAFVALAPQAVYSVRFGNLSMLAVGLILLALACGSRRPLTGGGLLGASIAVKPLAPMVALGWLLAGPTRALRLAGGVALGAAALLVLAFPHLDDLLALHRTDKVVRTVTFHRFPPLLGLETSALWISLPLALGFLWWLVRSEPGPGQRLALLTVACLAVTPVVWSHTLVLALPLEVMVGTVAWRRWSRRRAAVAGAWIEPAFVAVAVVAIQFAAGAGGVDDRAVALQLVAGAVPGLAPIFLVAYLLRATDRF